MILGGEVLTNGITLCLLVIRGIHQGFFVRPFPPSPSQPPSSSSSSLLFNKRFRIETLLGSHLRPLPPPPLFRRQERGLERGGVARYLLAGGRGRHEWLESKAAVLKVSHLFHWPGFEAALYATGSTLSSRLGNSRGRVIPPEKHGWPPPGITIGTLLLWLPQCSRLPSRYFVIVRRAVLPRYDAYDRIPQRYFSGWRFLPRLATRLNMDIPGCCGWRNVREMTCWWYVAEVSSVSMLWEIIHWVFSEVGWVFVGNGGCRGRCFSHLSIGLLVVYLVVYIYSWIFDIETIVRIVFTTENVK